MSAKYFFTIKGIRQSPATFEELKALAQRQELKRSDLLWTDGMISWQRAGLTPSIFEGLPPDLELTESTTEAAVLPANVRNSTNVVTDYIDALRHYAVFTGRATRSSFWTFFFINIAVEFVMGFIEGFLDMPGIASSLFYFAILIPTIAVGVRRMHDVDRSGWWVLLPIGNIIFWAEEGSRGTNQYGVSASS